MKVDNRVERELHAVVGELFSSPQWKQHDQMCWVDASGCQWMPVDASGCQWMPVDASGCQWMPVDASGRSFAICGKGAPSSWRYPMGDDPKPGAHKFVLKTWRVKQMPVQWQTMTNHDKHASCIFLHLSALFCNGRRWETHLGKPTEYGDLAHIPWLGSILWWFCWYSDRTVQIWDRSSQKPIVDNHVI